MAVKSRAPLLHETVVQCENCEKRFAGTDVTLRLWEQAHQGIFCKQCRRAIARETLLTFARGD